MGHASLTAIAVIKPPYPPFVDPSSPTPAGHTAATLPRRRRVAVPEKVSSKVPPGQAAKVAAILVVSEEPAQNPLDGIDCVAVAAEVSERVK